GYSSSLTLTPSGGIVSQTVYVRMKASTASSDVIGSITLSSSGAQTRYVTCNGVLNGTTYYVSTTGSNSNDGLTSSTAFATITYAISQVSSSCDKVYILNGTYDESNMDLTSTITIEGESESGVIIDNNDVNGEYCFKVTATNVDVTLKNLTIRDFKSGAGAALYTYERDNQIKFENVTVNSCYVNSTTYDGVVLIFHDAGATSSDSVVFRNCTFSDNTSAGNDYGTAITVRSYSYDYDYPILIENSTFDNNDGSGYSEGAVSISRGYSVEVRNSVFKNNTGHYYGSGLKIKSTGSSSGSSDRVTVENCLFHDNSCGFAGAALTLENTNGSVTNCTFAQNSNTSSSDYYVSNLDINSSTITVKNCIFQSDDSGNEMISGGNISYSLINGGSGGDSYTDGGNNITSSPSFTDASGNDFTLSSSSPAIDAGTSTGAPSTDILGTTRSTPDMGCYEFITPQWTGGAGTTDWNTAGNWSTGVVPGSSNDITIPTTVTDPVITGSVSARNLTIESGGELTVSGSGSLSLSGDLDISGTITYTSSGSITLTKSGGTLSGTGSQTGAEYVISSGGSYTLNDDWSIDNINVNSGGSLDVATTKTLTTSSTLTNGGTLTCSGSGGLTIGGNATLSGSTTMGSGTLDVKGNYDNTGTFTSGTSTFKMSGTSAQTINSTNVSVTIPAAGTNTVTLLSEDFSSSSTGYVTQSVSTTNNYQVVNDCTNETWEVVTSHSEKCGSCTGNFVGIEWYSSSCTQDNVFVTKQFSPTQTTISISFDYLFDHYSADYFEVYLYNDTDGSQVGADLVYVTVDTDGSFSSTVNLTGSNSTSDNYTLRFHYYGNYDYGASFDNILITEDVTTTSNLTLSNEFYNVVIDNSNGIDLSTADIGYSNTLTLTNGVITTGTDDTLYVESTSASALPNGSSSSFINGNVKFNIGSNTDTYSIPLGDGTASTDYYRVDLVNNNLVGV
ncbi:MAG: choice-of-anchor Q domain-containing protein, partial [Candidatus Hodarchaeales archaeon]